MRDYSPRKLKPPPAERVGHVGCFAFVVGLATPRLVMLVLWIFTDYLGRAYEGVVLPLLGFFLLPTTTLTYAVAENESGGLEGWGILIVVIGVVLDLGMWGSGRGLFHR
jgi:hypothetical protein